MHDGRRRRFTLGVGAVAASLLAACASKSEAPASGSAERTLRVGLGQVVASAPSEGLRALAQIMTVELLARQDDDGRPEPQLARDWSLSADHLSLTVNLVPGVKFHDGTPVTAAVVA